MNNKKVLGLCVLSINDEYIVELMHHLHNECIRTNNKLMVFGSGVNSFDTGISQAGAFALFNIINYDLIDALVIVKNRFIFDDVLNRLVTKAKEKGVPVILINGDRDDCYNITLDGLNVLEKILRELILVNEIKDVFFLAGVPGEKTNDERFDVFKRVCKEAGITVTDKMVGKGEYWERPTAEVIKTIIRENRVPKLIVCANDVMAIEAARILTSNGYKIPEDVMITGYDGIEMSKFNSPSITTCAKDLSSAAALCISCMEKGKGENVKPENFRVEHLAMMRESTANFNNRDGYKEREEINSIYRRTYENRRHETELFNWIEGAISVENLQKLKEKLIGHIPSDSFVCIKQNLAPECADVNIIDPMERCYTEIMDIFALNVVPEVDTSIKSYCRDLVIPQRDYWMENDSVCMLTALYVDDEDIGYFVHYSFAPEAECAKVNRFSVLLNLIFRSMYRRIDHELTIRSIETAKYVNPISKLANIKGFLDWFNEFSKDAENHKRAISMSIYNIKRYKYIFENYGVDDIEEVVSYVARAFRSSSRPSNTFLSQIAEDDFAVFNYSDLDCEDKDQQIQDMICETTNTFYSLIGSYNAVNGKPYNLEINAGATWASEGWNEQLNTYIKLANGNLYLNRLKYGSDAVVADNSDQKKSIDDAKKKELELKFELLIEKNLFTYFFQPLVDAHTGEIYAYEALMRTTKEVGLFPLEILDIATEKNKLYSIEYATFFNVFERFQQDFDEFKGRKVFINTIPGHFLSKDDLNALKEKYSKFLAYSVIELTEGESLGDSEIEIMKNLTDTPLNCMLAVDDYGTGHSNIVNVLRYNPNIIKIDRYLITNIQEDTNKQMFVKNAIEFARANNIKVVAEGVENLEELNMVIKLGADLIQGYYTAKPAPEPLDQIPEEIKAQIVEAYNRAQMEA